MRDIRNDELKICILIAYFGKLPSCFPLWRASAGRNETIDFIVVSDIPAPALPKNIRWVPMTLPQMKEMAEKQIGMEVRLQTPYECCDLKAAYGVIFEELLQGYDYWGYCDMDMVFGDLRSWFDRYDLWKYDKFLSFGHLTLMRNTSENNQRFRLPCTPGKGYEDAFKAPGSTHFCEAEINRIYNCYGFPFFQQRICADIDWIYRRMRLSGDFPDYKYQAFFWQEGKVWRAYKKWYPIGFYYRLEVEEFPYIHFQKRNMQPASFDAAQVSRYYICRDHFEEKTALGYPAEKDLKKMNPYPGRAYEWFEKIFKVGVPAFFHKFHKS